MDIFSGRPIWQWLADGEVVRQAFDALIQVSLSMVIAAIAGFERERGGHPAGIRTHMLLALGVAVFTIVSRAYSAGDQSRIAAQVVTGVGFLGAGTIMRLGIDIKGLTTAASLWAVSALTMAICSTPSTMWVGIIGGILIVFTLVVVDKIEDRFIKPVKRCRIRFDLNPDGDLANVLALLDQMHANVSAVKTIHHDPVVATVDIRGPVNEIVAAATRLKDVKSVEWTD